MPNFLPHPTPLLKIVTCVPPSTVLALVLAPQLPQDNQLWFQEQIYKLF